jgi:hypothetical protein
MCPRTCWCPRSPCRCSSGGYADRCPRTRSPCACSFRGYADRCPRPLADARAPRAGAKASLTPRRLPNSSSQPSSRRPRNSKLKRGSLSTAAERMPYLDPLPPAEHPPFMPLLFPEADETSEAARLHGVLDTRPPHEASSLVPPTAIQQPSQMPALNPTLRVAAANHQQPSENSVCMCTCASHMHIHTGACVRCTAVCRFTMRISE